MSTSRGRTHGRLFNLSVQPMHAFVTYTIIHNQTGNRAVSDRPSMNLAPVQQVLKVAVIACNPFTPTLSQDEEWGASTPFTSFCFHGDSELQRLTREGRFRKFTHAGWDPKDVPSPSNPETFHHSKLSRQEVSEDSHATVLVVYRDLLTLQKSHLSLRTP